MSVSATFATVDNNTFAGQAVTHDPKVVPPGAMARVTEKAANGKTTITLTVSGMLPNRGYGAHVHIRPCGVHPEDSGPHYQHQQDPKTPSTDPSFANPSNEVWLDFATTASGEGFATATLDWTFDARRPHSVVIHAMRTATAAGTAGTAGARAGCINVDF